MKKIHDITAGEGSTNGCRNTINLPTSLRAPGIVPETTNSTADTRYESAILSLVKEPDSIEEALHGKDSDTWVLTMVDKLESMRMKEIFKLVKLLPDTNIVGSQWMFLLKLDENNASLKAKARLVT